MKQYLFPALLIIVMLAGFVIRFFRVGESPPSVNWDEAALGYNAYSLLKTGKDEYSVKLPVSLRSFDDYKPAVYSYLIVPWLKVLSLSDMSTRLPSVIFGAILIFSLAVIAYKLTSSRTVSIATAVFLAFEPWAVHFSRVAFESNVASSLLWLSLACFVTALKKPSKYYLAVILAVISMYTYHSQRFIALPLLFSLTWMFKLKIYWKKVGGVITILLIPLMINFLTAPITSRLKITNMFKLWPFVPKEYSKLIYNPFYSMAWHVGGKYLTYFSPTNLYVRGSSEPGQYVPTLGLLQMVEFPLVLIGLAKLTKSKKFLKFCLPIAFLTPLPAVVTWNWFSTVRTLSLYPLFSFIAALGLTKLKPLLGVAFVIFYLPSVVYLVNTEILYAPKMTYGEYQPGFEKSVPMLLDMAWSYDRVVIDSPHSNPYIFLLFYGKYNPALYQSRAAFDKFEFRQIKWDEDQKLSHTLFMGPTVRLPNYEFENTSSAKIQTDIYDVLGYISLRIVTTN